MVRTRTLILVLAAVLSAASLVCAQGIITTVAGSAKAVLGGGPPLTAPLGPVSGIVIDASGNVIVADPGNNVVVSIAPLGVLSVIAGTGVAGFSGDTGLATKAQLNSPQGLFLTADGSLLIADRGNNRICKVDTNGFINTVAGNGTAGFSGDGDLAINAQLNAPAGVAVDAFGTIYIADSGNNRVRRIQRVITTFAGTGVAGFSGDGGAAGSAQLNNPVGLALDPFFGNLYISDSGNNRIRLVTVFNDTISTVAGTGVAGFSGDGGPAVKAQLNAPQLLSSTSSGTLYLADSGNNVVRKLFAGGQIATVAGNTTAGFSGDGGAATQAQLNNPMGMVSDSGGNIFITDAGNFRIREVVAADGTINTIAGSGTFTFAGDGGPATSAILSNPMGVVVDTAGNFYIADTLNERIRKVVAAGTISTVAGNGIAGFSGDGAAATSAQLNLPSRVALDAGGNLYVADTKNNVVRKVTPAGTISTVAGNGTAGFAGDGGPATSAQLNNPVGLALDAAGNLFIN